VSADSPKTPDKPDSGAGQTSAPDAEVDTVAGSTGRAGHTGRVNFDHKGSAIWEWCLATGAFGREVSTQRLHKLEHPALSLAADAPTPHEGVRANPLGTKKGYDPYDSGRLGKGAEPRRKKDLRRLSEYIQLKKQAAGNKNDE
jgi:hypothetical protein